MEAIDWGKIKTEYVTGLSSYQDLADKYHVNKCTIARHGRQEGWPEERKRYATKKHTKAAKKIEDKQVDRMARLQGGAEAMLGKLISAVNTVDPEMLLAEPKLARSLTGALRDLKEVMDCKSALDMEEQMARIEKLRQKDSDGPGEIKITVEGGKNYGC